MNANLKAFLRIVFCSWMFLACCAPRNALAQAPTNDTCTGAIPPTNGVPYVMSTTNATSAGDAPQCWAGFTKGVWFNYTPNVNGLVIVTTCASDFPTFVTVNANSCAALQ